ncbi:hypothetical protein GCM10023184_38650 [Flaviaesturariibacter amylovorans]|uniref:DUF2147 domain-containing protein n=1 Tax=Flaviaesturariibacter amylovorans TaxID=1084520 RepID=A0ABP8HKW7_9BACT
MQKSAKTTSLIIALLWVSGLKAQSTGDALLGTWELEDGSVRIQVYNEAPYYTGKIVVQKGSTTAIGNKVLWNMRFDPKENEWNNGKIQMPDMGHPAHCSIRLKDVNTAIVTGYHGFRFLGKSRGLHRLR